jgi:membrane protease YdiL (CAAX protease family)
VSSPAKVARTITWAGIVLFWATLAVLVWVAEMSIVDSILLSVLLAAVPAFSLAQVPLIEGAEIVRLPAYWGSIVTLWLLGTACWFVGTRLDGASAVGLVSIGPLPLLAWSLALTAGGMTTIWVFRAIGLRTGVKESRLLRELLPRTSKERRVFALLSVAAGSGEEMAYRGYAIPVLAPLLGVPGAAILTTLIFGVLHSYQGWLGIVRTSVMGGILAWGFLASGSLWPSIIAHTAIDLLAGIALGHRLLSPEASTGVPGSDT